MIPVDSNPDLARTQRGNVVNTNKKALEQARKRKAQLNRLDKLEEDVQEIKSMLKELLNK